MKTPLFIFFLFLAILGYFIQAQTGFNSSKTSTKNKLVFSEAVQQFIPEPLINQDGIFVLKNGKIIDGTGGPILENQVLIVENGKFKEIGDKTEIDIPVSATEIDLKGKTLIPGLVGVHNHLHIPGFPYSGEIACKLYLACGVTTIQTCGAADAQGEIKLAQQIKARNQLGPDIIASAPYFTGPGGNSVMIIPRNEQHIRDTMQHWIQQGIKWFKVYRHTLPEDLQVIIDEAHQNQGKVTGHFCSITHREAIEMGIDGIEHGLNSAADFRTNKEFGICGGGRRYMDTLEIESKDVKALHELMIQQNVHLNSTLSIYESGIAQRGYADERTMKVMSLYLQNQYRERRSRNDERMNDSSKLKRLKRIMAYEYQFFQMGGLLGSGVDAGRHNMFGFGDQRNYELLIEAGFTCEEAIMVMTNNGAKILGNPNIGSIEMGKQADFVILNGDLTTQASTIRNVEYVFKKGVAFDSKSIIEACEGQVGID